MENAQISEKIRILLARSQGKGKDQIPKESGLSQGMIHAWQIQWEKRQPITSQDFRINESSVGQATVNPHQKSSGNPFHKPPENAFERPEVMGRPIIHRMSLGMYDQPIKTKGLAQYPPHDQAWLFDRENRGVNDFIELRRVFRLMARWWWLIVLITLSSAAAGFIISLKLKPVYEATSSVIVGQSIQAKSLDSRDFQTSERLALSYADIARRKPILEATNVTLNLGYPWQNLKERVKVEIVPDTQLLEISVEAGSPEEAILIADEIARQLILLSPTSLRDKEGEASASFIQQRLKDLQKKIETNQIKLDDLNTQLSQATTPEHIAELKAEINILEGLIVDWENTYAKFLDYVNSEQSANYIAVMEKAHAKNSPIRPAKRMNTLVAGIVGFVLALGIVFLLEFLDDTLKTEENVAQDLNLIPLGSIGQFEERGSREKMIVSNNPRSTLSESYRMIRNNIQYMFLDKPGRSILVTSPTPGDGKSTTAVNLAIVFAFNGKKTIIVDADLRKPKLHEIFQVPNGWGLTNQLCNPQAQGGFSLINTEVERLYLLTAGTLPPNPSELLGSQRMEQLIANLMKEADVVIFDSPPVTYVADAAALSKYVDGVVLVVSSGKTRRDVTKQAVFYLQQASANILGVILNRTTLKNGGYNYEYTPTTERYKTANLRIIAGLQHTWDTLTLSNWRRRS